MISFSTKMGIMKKRKGKWPSETFQSQRAARQKQKDGSVLRLAFFGKDGKDSIALNEETAMILTCFCIESHSNRSNRFRVGRRHGCQRILVPKTALGATGSMLSKVIQNSYYQHTLQAKRSTSSEALVSGPVSLHSILACKSSSSPQPQPNLTCVDERVLHFSTLKGPRRHGRIQLS
jgi:hypothetical protein